ncbi:hypothetical protein HDU78_003580 [Chytriomyces hyalinus]|nr:hypothetical protein HDU78_003580 [Chytriomyces hyalinus]
MSSHYEPGQPFTRSPSASRSVTRSAVVQRQLSLPTQRVVDPSSDTAAASYETTTHGPIGGQWIQTAPPPLTARERSRLPRSQSQSHSHSTSQGFRRDMVDVDVAYNNHHPHLPQQPAASYPLLSINPVSARNAAEPLLPDETRMSPRSTTPNSSHRSSDDTRSGSRNNNNTPFSTQNTFTLARPSKNIVAAASLHPNPSSQIHSSPTIVGLSTTPISFPKPPQSKPMLSGSALSISPLPTPHSIKDNLPPTHIDPRDFVALSIYYHEETPHMDLATYYASLSAAGGNSVGLFLYGVALRHGLGVQQDTVKGIEILSKSADAAMSSYTVGSLSDVAKSGPNTFQGAKSFAASGTMTAPVSFTDTLARLPGTGAVRMLAKKELGMVLFEIGNSYKNGWGVSKSESTALYYYLVSSGLGEVDAHVALGDSYLRGECSCKKDKKVAAKYYRLAVEAGYKEPSLHWIYKDKWR